MDKRRPFDYENFRKNDQPAKEAIKEHFELGGWNVWYNPDQYGIDLYAEMWGIVIGLEPQRNQSWETGPFPHKWRTVFIPRRKENRISLLNWLYVVCFDLSRAIRVYSMYLRNGYLEPIQNKYMPDEGPGYCVPVDLCQEIILRKRP